MKIAVSILKTNYSELETIQRINDTKADYLHLDIMDGSFVPEKTSEFEYLDESNKKIQVHIMVTHPLDYINKYNLSNVETIIIQSELNEDIRELLKYIKSLGKKAGLALNPETPTDVLSTYYDLLDYVLVLTVHPGVGGQKMLNDVISKIDELNHHRQKDNLNFEIIVDGGVNDETINLIKKADIAVVGSFICTSDDFNSQIEKLYLNIEN